MKLKKKILITGIGSDIAQGMCRIIKQKFPSCKIYGSDIGYMHSGKLFADRLTIFPRADRKIEYIKKLNSYIQKNKIDLFIPTSETEILLFDKYKKKIKINKFICPSTKLILIGSDKYKTYQYLKSLGIQTPWTYQTKDLKKPIKFPCLVKGKHGRGSKNLFICNNSEEAKFFSKYFKNGIFQEILVPKEKEITCAIYRFKNKEIKILQLLRSLKDGYTVWSKVVKNKNIETLCRNLTKKINFYGPANFQLILTKKGPRIFEINPRFSSTILMRNYLGFTDFIWSIEEAFNLKITKKKILSQKIISRFDEIKFLN